MDSNSNCRKSCHANINNLQKSDRNFKLIGSLGFLKEVKPMDMILGKCKFPNSFLPYFQ